MWPQPARMLPHPHFFHPPHPRHAAALSQTLRPELTLPQRRTVFSFFKLVSRRIRLRPRPFESNGRIFSNFDERKKLRHRHSRKNKKFVKKKKKYCSTAFEYNKFRNRLQKCLRDFVSFCGDEIRNREVLREKVTRPMPKLFF